MWRVVIGVGIDFRGPPLATSSVQRFRWLSWNSSCFPSGDHADEKNIRREVSSLGGWIATRAGGHFATLYTHIDDLVESVRAITPRGTWQSRRLPGSGAGPSPDRMLIGSEGTLGVITEAWVRLQDRPDAPRVGGRALPRRSPPAPTP